MVYQLYVVVFSKANKESQSFLPLPIFPTVGQKHIFKNSTYVPIVCTVIDELHMLLLPLLLFKRLFKHLFFSSTRNDKHILIYVNSTV
jgi:hypothetical protein